jgi:hypothetical protein
VTVSEGLVPTRLAVSCPCAVYVDGAPASGWLAAMLVSLSVQEPMIGWIPETQFERTLASKPRLTTRGMQVLQVVPEMLDMQSGVHPAGQSGGVPPPQTVPGNTGSA